MAQPLDAKTSHYSRRHLLFAWWSLLPFLTLGIVLETFHGFKLGWYLDTGNETRRLMFTLAHAHGTLLRLVHAAFAASLPRLSAWSTRGRDIASLCLIGASVLLPLGFLLGGIWIYAGEPGLWVVLAPIGGTLLLVTVLLTAIEVGRAPPKQSAAKSDLSADA